MHVIATQQNCCARSRINRSPEFFILNRISVIQQPSTIINVGVDETLAIGTSMSSTTVNVGVDETTLIQAGKSITPHSFTHVSGGNDEINHNLLNGLQGGSNNEYYHISSEQYVNLTTGSVIRPSQTGQFYPRSNPSGFITGINNIYIEGDSLLVISQVCKKWKIRNEILMILCDEVNELLKSFTNVGLKHIYREYNSYADSLSDKTIKMKKSWQN